MTVQTLQLRHSTTNFSEYSMDPSGDKEERKREVSRLNLLNSYIMRFRYADVISVRSTIDWHRENSVRYCHHTERIKYIYMRSMRHKYKF